jgi:hypothetical protein
MLISLLGSFCPGATLPTKSDRITPNQFLLEFLWWFLAERRGEVVPLSQKSSDYLQVVPYPCRTTVVARRMGK